MDFIDSSVEERTFGEFRRKVRSAEVLSAAMEKNFYPQFILRAGSASWCRMAAC